MGMTKQYANLGVERNKKPLKNIIIKVRISQLASRADIIDAEKEKAYEKFRYGDGYLTWGSGTNGGCMGWHGFITPDELKSKLGTKQWSKFCQGKMEFVIQRRVDGRNVKINR